MKIFYQPVSPFVINQRFAENKACVDLETNKKVITCDGNNPPAGYKSLYGPQGHRGLDLRSYHGQEVYCAQHGEVVDIDTNSKSGLDVKVFSVIEGRIFRHIYEHLLGYQPQIGDKVETGQLIGWADNTGYSSDDHLHFELQEWIGGKWVPVDPMIFMENRFAKDQLAINNTIKYLFEQVAMLADKIADYLRKRSVTNNN